MSEQEQTPSDALSGLAADLDRSHKAFHEEIARLVAFVFDSEKGFEGVRQPLESVHEKTAAAIESGTPLSGPKGPIGLTDEETTALRDELAWRLEAFKRYPNMLRVMALTYGVALFDAYVDDVLGAVLASRTEMLRSRKKMLAFEAILAAEERGERLIAVMVREELAQIAYSSFPVGSTTTCAGSGLISRRAGSSSPTSQKCWRAETSSFINSGIVDAQYLRAAPESEFSLGDRLDVSPEYWENAWGMLRTVARHFHESLREKFVPESDAEQRASDA
jgi:hypothetical protein